MIKVAVCIGMGYWLWRRFRPQEQHQSTIVVRSTVRKFTRKPGRKFTLSREQIEFIVGIGLWAYLFLGSFLLIGFLWSRTGMTISLLATFLAMHWLEILIGCLIVLTVSYFIHLLCWHLRAARIEQTTNQPLPEADTFFDRDRQGTRQSA
ncbi:hypothetical protein SH668x_000040 [Planctomicrobium sp. SH668]|uniref:hypothetical protein n=1 Tax=Planctomicrobium sp. SH668 TaxID=3448126 RepID=UPI003F5C7FB5